MPRRDGGANPRFSRLRRRRRSADDWRRAAGPVTIPRVDPKPVAESRALLAHLMGPTDANGSGNIHGGTIMKLTDEVAALAAVKHARTRVVTVGMDRMDFLVPIYVGALVTFTALRQRRLDKLDGGRRTSRGRERPRRARSNTRTRRT